VSFLLINTCQNESWVALADSQKIIQVERWLTSRVSNDLLERTERICAGQKISKIGVVTGPGGFTSARVGVVLANALAKTWRIPVVGVANVAEPEELYQAVREQAGEDLTKPFYQYPPHITTPKK